MKRITYRNSNGSIDILDEYGYTEYIVANDENGLISTLVNRICELEELLLTDKLNNVLSNYFDISSDTYSYNLTRSKEAFNVGTMTLDDFEEFDEDTINDLAEYIRCEL